jgi:hypothetical protein
MFNMFSMMNMMSMIPMMKMLFVMRMMMHFYLLIILLKENNSIFRSDCHVNLRTVFGMGKNPFFW